MADLPLTPAQEAEAQRLLNTWKAAFLHEAGNLGG